MIAALVGHGAEVMARDNWGETPLHIAARYNASPDVIAALVGHGAEVMTWDKAGWTPLHSAAGYNASPPFR